MRDPAPTGPREASLEHDITAFDGRGQEPRAVDGVRGTIDCYLQDSAEAPADSSRLD